MTERSSVVTTQTVRQQQYKANEKASKCLRHISHTHSVGAEMQAFISVVFLFFSFSRKFSSVMTRIIREPLTATRCAMQSMMQVLLPVFNVHQSENPYFGWFVTRMKSETQCSLLKRGSTEIKKSFFFPTTEFLKYPNSKSCMSCQPAL